MLKVSPKDIVSYRQHILKHWHTLPYVMADAPVCVGFFSRKRVDTQVVSQGCESTLIVSREYSHYLTRLLSFSVFRLLHGWHDCCTTPATIFPLRNRWLSPGDGSEGTFYLFSTQAINSASLSGFCTLL